jgi:hypothetical protein
MKLNSKSNPVVIALIESMSKNVTKKELSLKISQVKEGTSVKFNDLRLYGKNVISVKRSMARKGFKMVKQDYSTGTADMRSSRKGIRFVYENKR